MERKESTGRICNSNKRKEELEEITSFCCSDEKQQVYSFSSHFLKIITLVALSSSFSFIPSNINALHYIFAIYLNVSGFYQSKYEMNNVEC